MAQPHDRTRDGFVRVQRNDTSMQTTGRGGAVLCAVSVWTQSTGRQLLTTTTPASHSKRDSHAQSQSSSSLSHVERSSCTLTSYSTRFALNKYITSCRCHHLPSACRIRTDAPKMAHRRCREGLSFARGCSRTFGASITDLLIGLDGRDSQRDSSRWQPINKVSPQRAGTGTHARKRIQNCQYLRTHNSLSHPKKRLHPSRRIQRGVPKQLRIRVTRSLVPVFAPTVTHSHAFENVYDRLRCRKLCIELANYWHDGGVVEAFCVFASHTHTHHVMSCIRECVGVCDFMVIA